MSRQPVSVDGLADLEKMMIEHLPKSTGRGVLRRVGTAALGIFVERARDLAPRASGDLAESLAVSTRLDPKQRRDHRRLVSDDKAAVEIFGGAAALPHAHLVEFGTVERHLESGGSTGTMPAQPFMRPAWDATREAVLDDIAEGLGREIAATVARRARRLAKKRMQGGGR
ncbi:hypothetical protein BV509_12335 [Rhodovulum sulfidophilum]|uniref:HK97 gp10 family phage protein n=1 Tax=Rhodovulum visakhapatnamense TaxID=364297 RepID=A0ABS1RLL1_9RHOB|nr:HK97-gp10 family putative phage morphogenesis protein [Rhodovulum visakhapatnamense]MBL3571970.1 HK97 gp10 family phage protein [Rhodovulum visakhapatnamense]MBL3580555.1 HK97 gp10 family phage protein [Rhodovulum visakhapatnamense]OLS45047.1 hypothetical protein BV509_12335 [Rhodovulum sulfidophilum]